MKCKVCQRPMVLLFTSWACDHCDGKTKEPEEVSGAGYVRVPGKEFWVALYGPDAKELSSHGYRRAKIKLIPAWQASTGQYSPQWCGDASFPTATGEWDVDEGALMDAETGGLVVTYLDLNWAPKVRSGDTLRINVSTSLASLAP